MRQSDTTTLVLIEGYRDSNYVQMDNELVPELATSAFPCLRNLVYVSKDANEPTTPGMMASKDMLALGHYVSDDELDAAQASTAATDIINIRYTSRTATSSAMRSW